MCVAEEGSGRRTCFCEATQPVGPEVEPGVPEMLGRLAATFTTGAEKRQGSGGVADRPEKPDDGAGHGQPALAVSTSAGASCPTPSDFGQLGEPSTHPELLDWLAAELMTGGWHIKRMHRLIVTVKHLPNVVAGDRDGTGGRPRQPLVLAVPDAQALGRGDPRRDPGRQRQPEPQGGRAEHLPADPARGAGRPVGSGFRMERYRLPRNRPGGAFTFTSSGRLQVPILATHDSPDTDSSCPVRYTTTVPTQALGLLNGAFANEQAALFAQRLRRERPGCLDDQVRRAIRLTTGVDPPADEVARDVAWIDSMRQDSSLTADAALREYCLLVLSTNAFLYID